MYSKLEEMRCNLCIQSLLFFLNRFCMMGQGNWLKIQRIPQSMLCPLKIRFGFQSHRLLHNLSALLF